MSFAFADTGIVGIRIDREELGVTRAEFNDLKRVTFSAMANDWHDNYRDLHFQESAYERYGYVARKGMRLTGKAYRRSYVGQKKHKKGHNRPLEFSGESRSLTRLKNIRTTFNESRVILPSAFNRRHEKSQIRMRDELTRVLPGEADEIAQTGATAMGRRLDEIYASKR